MMNDAASGESAEDVSRRVCQRIRDLRSDSGWSLEMLSQASGVSRSMLSQIEREQANPTLAVTVKIASAFGLSVGDLVQGSHVVSSISVIRGSDRRHLFREDEDCTIRTLSPLNLEKDVEFYELKLPAGRTLKSAAHFDGTREFLTVQRGSVEVTSGAETVQLNKGDSAGYRADVTHQIRNTHRSESVVFLVVIYR
ncbi:MAG: XRE family transcriptional regulator [Planctomycetaceae bacterium]